MLSNITKLRLAIETNINLTCISRICEISAMAGYRPKVDPWVAACDKTYRCNHVLVEKNFSSFNEFASVMADILVRYGRIRLLDEEEINHNR